MDNRLTGTVALVTGASSGIGEMTARRLARDGAAVAVLARREDRLQALAAELRQAGTEVAVVVADVADPQQAESAVAQTMNALGRLDVVVNNAGVMTPGPLLDVPTDACRQMIDVNVAGVVNMTKAVLPHLILAAAMSPRNVADLVMISSTAGRVARSGNAMYSLTKFGVNAFAESLRQEMLHHRVRVGIVEPGTVDTEMAAQLRDGMSGEMADQLRTMQLLHPEDIADAVSYMVTRDRRVAVNEMLVRAGEQTW